MADGGTPDTGPNIGRWPRPDGWLARGLALVACAGIWSFAVTSVTAAGGTPGGGARSADAPPLVPQDLLVAPRLTEGEAGQIGDVERTSEAAARPTATSTPPPTATATAFP